MLLASLLLTNCSSPEQPASPSPHRAPSTAFVIDQAQLYDKILGTLVGSAIGDAMGAPTEMWSRQRIATHYGFVDHLDTMVRAPSGEGIWGYNLPAGGTTDDTRWKKLVAEYLLAPSAPFGSNPPDAVGFARHIVTVYLRHLQTLQTTEGPDPEPYESACRGVAWLQEWARVAQPYAEGDLEAYSVALHRFYGGEMTCAGLLYSPVVGALYPAQPERAYRAAYQLSLFDLGYARDISALAAAMVATAMQPSAQPNDIINVVRDVDPHDYFRSRLVGRAAYRILEEARSIVYTARQLPLADVDTLRLSFPSHLNVDTLFLGQMQRAYELLDQRNQDVPFHAGEIHLVNLTALLFCNFDFERSLAFVTNYGRDNDTTGALTGAILGAYWGFDQLPDEMKTSVLTQDSLSAQVMLPQLAQQLTDRFLRQ